MVIVTLPFEVNLLPAIDVNRYLLKVDTDISTINFASFYKFMSLVTVVNNLENILDTYLSNQYLQRS
jgi:hypothetical protein